MKVTAVYFSPTGTSAKGVNAIAAGIDQSPTKLDLTIRKEEPVKKVFDEKDVVVFGGPVYGSRIYRGFKERMANLQGHDTPCVITVTYGNIKYGDALLELSDFVKTKGFKPIAAALLIGQHTFGTVATGRPEHTELTADIDFGKKVLKKLKSGCLTEVEVPGKRPYIKGDKGGLGASFVPLTSDACIQCKICAKSCPEQAINYDCVSEIDPDKCISCFRCIQVCPVQAKNADFEVYNNFAENITKAGKDRRESEYML